MNWLAAWGLLKRCWPALLIVGVIGAAWLMLGKIDAQTEQIAKLQNDLKAEQAARAADVTGLTTLAKGAIAAAVETKKDERALDHAIATQPVSPATPLLRAYLACLRDTDGKNCTTSGPSGPVAK